MRDHRSRKRTSSLISPPLIGTLRTQVAYSSQAPSWLDSSILGALQRYRRGHGFESCSTFTCFKSLQSLTKSAFEMRKKKTSNENTKAQLLLTKKFYSRSCLFQDSIATYMELRTIVTYITDLTSTYAVQPGKWIIIHYT